MSVTWSWDLQAYISSSWVSIKRDVEIFKTPTIAKRGISGSGITDRVAAPGSLSTSLDNGQSNSGGKLGYYSPGHTDARANFGRNTLIRLKITYDGTDNYKWYGYITDLEPSIGQFGERSSTLSATDYLQRMTAQRIELLAVQQDKRSDEIITTIISAMVTAPLNTIYATDKFTLPFGLSSDQDEKTTAMGAVQKVCQTVLGYIFVKGNTTDGETLVFQTEEARALKASAATLNNTMVEMSVKRPAEDIRNKLIGKVHPMRVDDDDTTLLFELDNEIYVDGGETKTFKFNYKDPFNLATRISAIDIVTPLVAGTHYRASKLANTTDNDADAILSITPSNGGNSSSWAIQNTGGYRAFINMINIFGKGIYSYNPVTLIKETGSADKETSYDFFYLSDLVRAEGFMSRLLTRASASTPEVETVTFFADENATLMDYAMDLDIGDRVTVQEAATGLNGAYTINNVSYSIGIDGTLRVDWGLEPADTSDYFILNSSLLDGTKVLSPY